MARVFGSSNLPSDKSDKFDIKLLTEAAARTDQAKSTLKANRSESDFAAVRKPIMKRRESAAVVEGDHRESPSSQRAHHHHHHPNDDEDEPLVSERARGDPHYDSDSAEDVRRVQFSAGSPPKAVKIVASAVAAAEASGTAGEGESGHDEDEAQQLEDHRKRKG